MFCRLTLLALLIFVASLCLRAEVAEPVLSTKEFASVGDLWRWDELDCLNDYRIKLAATDEAGHLWFLHDGGLLHYDGKKLEDFPIAGLEVRNEVKLHVMDGGSIYIVFLDGILRSNGSVIEVGAGDLFFFGGDCLVEATDGRLIVGSTSGLYC